MHNGGLMQVVQPLRNVQQAKQDPGIAVHRLHARVVAASRRRRLRRQAPARQQLGEGATVAVLADLPK